MTECDRQTDIGRDVEDLAARLHRLLEEQLAAGREGNVSRVERLGRQADEVVARIVESEGVVLEARRRDLERSYQALALILRGEQDDVQRKLRQLRRVKRAVNAYRTDR